jgi:hypothetical protein
MAFSGNNQTLYNAALNGCLAGQVAARQIKDAVTADYAVLGNVATIFAQEVDAQIAADATLSAAGATVVPASAANQQNALTKSNIMFAICFGLWFSRGGAADVTLADYLADALAVKAVFLQAVAQYALAAGGTSLS